MNKIIACIDDSHMATSVCDTAIWASKRLAKPIMFLHTLEKTPQHGADDLTGTIGLGARSSLLEKMAILDEEQGKEAMQMGNELLATAVARANAAGIKTIEQKQRHGDFVEALAALEAEARLMVVGRSGQGHQGDFKAVGAHIERLIRQVNTAVVIAPESFTEPRNFMLAYDGRQVADEVLQRIIDGGLLKGATCHLVTIENNERNQKEKFQQAKTRLAEEGFEVIASYLQGDIYASLMEYYHEHNIALVIMGAFAHSKVRQFFLGSNTMRMIENCQTPLIVLK